MTNIAYEVVDVFTTTRFGGIPWRLSLMRAGWMAR